MAWQIITFEFIDTSLLESDPNGIPGNRPHGTCWAEGLLNSHITELVKHPDSVWMSCLRAGGRVHYNDATITFKAAKAALQDTIKWAEKQGWFKGRQQAASTMAIRGPSPYQIGRIPYLRGVKGR